MSRILEYMTSAASGLERYLTGNKMIVLLFALLLVFGLAGRKRIEQKGNRMLIYTLVLSVLLICPITAAAVMIYQTGYYDYEWAWSMVPVTIVIAYGITLLIKEQPDKKQTLVGLLMAAAVFFLCGNQGTLQVAETREADAMEDVQELLQCIQGRSGRRLLWAPKNIMQEMRRQDGNILLIYGRDMWDAKAGAYDYEAYSEGLTRAYLWLEELMVMEEQVEGLTDALELVELSCEEQGLAEEVSMHMELLVTSGVNTYVLPHVTAAYIEESLSQAAKAQALEIETAYTEEYTIYFLE